MEALKRNLDGFLISHLYGVLKDKSVKPQSSQKITEHKKREKSKKGIRDYRKNSPSHVAKRYIIRDGLEVISLRI
jgi:hypothetical protein